MTSNQITIALTKGRIEKDTVKLLEKAGFDMSFMADKGRNLIFESPDKRFRFLLVKAIVIWLLVIQVTSKFYIIMHCLIDRIDINGPTNRC